jgi:hypothetical protein
MPGNYPVNGRVGSKVSQKRRVKMVAKIGRGENLTGALTYNQLKVDKENGQVLSTNKMFETPGGSYSVAQLYRSFEPYLLANRKTEKPVLHISINPAPKDKVSDEQFKSIAQEYMQQMGYGNQPFVVFKHTDIDRTHIHIVAVCVDEDGKKISDKFEKRRSMDVCRVLEQQYHLIPATEQKRQQDDRIFKPVDYKAGDIKSQVASVVRHLPNYYRFTGLGTYNALLSLFNITAEAIKGELHGQPKQGLVYFVLNEQGEKASNPFKASLFGKHAGYAQLQTHYEQSKEQLKNDPVKASLRNTISTALHTTSNEQEFKKQLLEQGINTVVRRNDEGRIYGITFIDHASKSVWNGSLLHKDLSANVFNEQFKEQATGERQETVDNPATVLPATGKSIIEEKEETHELFDFLKKEQPVYTGDDFGLINGLGGLLPEAQEEDYEEQAFANRMKKRKKNQKNKN